jgi:uncharacterized membrane protein
MPNSATSSSRPSTARLSRLAGAIALLALIGFIDSSYLAAKHYLGGPLPCTVFSGCEKVTTSRYAMFAGLPLGLWGAAYYLTLLLLAVGHVDTGRAALLRLAAGLSFAGFAASAWFVYLQLFVIRAICPYCMLSAATATALAVVGALALRRLRVPAAPPG